MYKLFMQKKLWYYVGGLATATIGSKVLQSKVVRDTTVKVLAKGIKLQDNAKATYENLKEDAMDICYEAKVEAKKENTAADTVTAE